MSEKKIKSHPLARKASMETPINLTMASQHPFLETPRLPLSKKKIPLLANVAHWLRHFKVKQKTLQMKKFKIACCIYAIGLIVNLARLPYRWETVMAINNACSHFTSLQKEKVCTTLLVN